MTDLPFLALIGLVTFLAVRALARRFARAPNLIGLGSGFAVALVATLVHFPTDAKVESASVARMLAVATGPSSLRDVSSLCHAPTNTPHTGANGNIDVLHVERRATSLLRVEGWATDRSTHALVRAVCVAIDGRIDAGASSSIGAPRPDVAHSIHDLKAGNSGFIITVPMGAYNPGQHLAQVFVLSRDGTFAALDSVRAFDL